MLGLFRRYGFAAVVATVLALMAVVVLVKSVLPNNRGAAAMAAAGPAGEKGKAKGPGGPGGQGEIVAVQATGVAAHEFSDAIQALGSAQARESIVITPKLSDVIRTIRFESGQRVRRGQVLVELQSTEQHADLAEVRAADAAAQEEYRRFQALFDRGFAPRAQLDSSRAAAGAAHARVEAAQSQINDRSIRAPFDGVMGLRTASPGQLVRPGDSLGTLDDVSQIKLDFDVAEAHIAALRPGVAVVARSPAYPDRRFEGRVAQVDSRVSTDTRTLRVRALLPNRDGAIRPGMLLSVEARPNARQALAVPEQAIVEDSNAPYVFVVAHQGPRTIAERRDVRAGQRADGWVEILSGLNEGESVIVDGVSRVRPGQGLRLGQTGGPPGAAAQRAAAPT